jgi:adenylate cyclase
MMGKDEAATLDALNTCDTEIIEPTVKEHNGRVFKRLGDGFLVEFSSAVDSVECAIAWQKQIEEKNFPLQFRIGINLGDVIAKDDDIYGDGVNIAARVEKLTDPGGICITQDIFNQIKKKLDIGFEYLGEQQVKNIPEPIRIYKLLVKPEDAGKLIGEKKTLFLKRPWLVLAGLALVVLTVGVVTLWNTIRQPEIEAAQIEKMAYALPEKPSIAVLPFVNLSDDPKQEYFSDGLTDEIITALSKVPKIFVIARDSVFSLKGEAVKYNKVAEELGVRYVLHGSVRKEGNKVRISTQLVDALSGHHVWADRYDRDIEEIFTVQDDLTKNIITALQVKLTEGEKGRVASKGTTNLEAYLKYLQSMDTIRRFNIESNALGMQLAQEAIDLDPEYAMPYRVLSIGHQMDVWLGTSRNRDQSTAKAMELMKKAIELDPNYAEAHGHLGFIYWMQGDYDKSIEKAEEAIRINPNSAYAHHVLGQILRLTSRYEEAIPEYKKALRLNPFPPTNYIFGMGLAYFHAGQVEKGIEWCEKAVEQDPDSFLANVLLTTVYGLSGQEEKAKNQAAEVLRINPKFSLEKWIASIRDQNLRERTIEALQQAGLE